MCTYALLRRLGVTAASLLRSARHLDERRRLTSLSRGVGLRKSPYAALLIFRGMVMREPVRWRSDVQCDTNEAFPDSFPCCLGVILRTFLFQRCIVYLQTTFFPRSVDNSFVLVVNLRNDRSLSRASWLVI